ncbi:MAG: type II toxin-antitoxin system HicA family toxin [Candidatus Wolfebacteria bacterium]|nr:type II toxin-antitoxin system HicA family toxin [Candidatus Wolfebacteria bacterium]
MKKLPSLKAREVVGALKKFGFTEDRQKGGHLVMVNNSTKRRTVIPVHGGKDIKKFLLKKIIEEDLGVSVEEFLKML